MSPVTQYVFDGRKWQNEVTSTRQTATAVAAGAVARKTGATYVRYEDVYVAGDTLQKTINRVTGNKVLTFPEGVFMIPASFSNGYLDGVRLGHKDWGPGCRGLSGSGRGTIFKMLSSTKTAPTSGVNSMMLINAVPRGLDPMISVEFSNFYLQGTNLGHDYNGLRMERCTNSLIENVLVTGIKGSNKVPPGETGSVQMQRCSYVTLNGVELDGRRDGIRVSSSLLMPNSSDHITVNKCYFHHTYTGGGGIAWYNSRDSTVTDTRSEYIGSGTGSKSGYCFNHEQTNRVIYRNPVMICDRKTTGGTLHMSLNADAARGGVDNVLTVYKPIWDATTVGSGKLVVETWALGGATSQMQRTPPLVFGPNDEITKLPITYLNPYI